MRYLKLILLAITLPIWILPFFFLFATDTIFFEGEVLFNKLLDRKIK
jgi:hypothetical protein